MKNVEENNKMVEVQTNDAAENVSSGVASTSRRRIFKKVGVVAVPVVATLASRPVLAWHCRTPSMWGSLVMNPNTSLNTHADHKTTFPDETWSIQGWKSNTVRSSTKVADRPWVYLVKNGFDKSKILAASLVNTTVGATDAARYVPLSGNPAATRYLDIQKVTVDEFIKATALVKPAGMSGSSKVYDVLVVSSTDFGAHMLVAQLNYKLLYPLSTNLMENCFGKKDLDDMATGSYSPATGMSWSKQDIIDYLEYNYVALPTDGYVLPSGPKKI